MKSQKSLHMLVDFNKTVNSLPVSAFINMSSYLWYPSIPCFLFDTCIPHWGRDIWTPFGRRYFQVHFLEWKCLNSYQNFTEVYPKDRINNIPALVQIMAWRRPGDKPLSEPIMVSLTTHICVTRPQWVNVHTIHVKIQSRIEGRKELLSIEDFRWHLNVQVSISPEMFSKISKIPFRIMTALNLKPLFPDSVQ